MCELKVETREINGSDLQATVFAWNIIARGYRGNGCGVSKYTHSRIRKFLTHPFGCDLTDCCLLHDAEDEMPRKYRSASHRAGATSRFKHNLRVKVSRFITLHSVRRWQRFILLKIPGVYSGVVASFLGKKAYWS